MAEHADVDKIVALLKKEETEADDLTVIEQLLAANPSVARATPELEGQGSQSLLFLLAGSKPNYKGDASNERNAEIARLLIAAGADVNAKLATPDPDLNFPLLFSAFQNDDTKNVKIVEQMIAAGADVNSFCSYGDIFKHSLLFCSIMEKGLLGGPALLDVFELLLAAGADVNSVSKTEDGDTITNLCMAVGRGFTTMVAKLIQAGADVNAPSKNVSNKETWMKAIGSMCTPLMVAAYKGDMEALVMLLEAKPDVTIKSSEGKTAADIAAENENLQIAQILQVISGGA